MRLPPGAQPSRCCLARVQSVSPQYELQEERKRVPPNLRALMTPRRQQVFWRDLGGEVEWRRYGMKSTLWQPLRLFRAPEGHRRRCLHTNTLMRQ